MVAYFSFQPSSGLIEDFCAGNPLSLFCHWVPNNQPTSSADKEGLLCRDCFYSCSSQQPTLHIRTVTEWLLLLIWECISSAETNMVVSQRYDFPPEGEDCDAGSKVIKSGTCLLWWIMIKSQVEEWLLSLLFSFPRRSNGFIFDLAVAHLSLKSISIPPNAHHNRDFVRNSHCHP